MKIDLPHASSQPANDKTAHVDIAVQADGSLLWNGRALSADALRARMAEAARATPQPELHLRADRKVPYERVADVMSAAQTGGLTKISFITDPRAKP